MLERKDGEKKGIKRKEKMKERGKDERGDGGRNREETIPSFSHPLRHNAEIRRVATRTIKGNNISMMKFRHEIDFRMESGEKLKGKTKEQERE